MERAESDLLFGKFSFWNNLNETEKRLLEQQISWKVYQEGQLVTGNGSECLGPFLVKYGTVRVYLVSGDGKEATVCRLHEGELCMLSGSCLLPDIPFDLQIDVENESGVYILPTGAVRKIMSANIYMENFVYKTMNESLSDIIGAVQKILFASLEQRLAEFLLNEAARCHSDQIIMTQEQIARAIGSAREAVSRTLKQMVQEGSVQLFRGGVKIMSRQKLYHKL